MELPPLPVPISQFVDYVNKFPQTQAAVADAVQPFKAFESKLREVYAQHPNHSAATINHLVSVFDAAELTVRARDLARETVSEMEMFLLPLRDAFRKTNGSLATVNTAKQFRTNFNIFSESSLVDLDWSNVVVAGSAVATCLLPVVAPNDGSKVTKSSLPKANILTHESVHFENTIMRSLLLLLMSTSSCTVWTRSTLLRKSNKLKRAFATAY